MTCVSVGEGEGGGTGSLDPDEKHVAAQETWNWQELLWVSVYEWTGSVCQAGQDTVRVNLPLYMTVTHDHTVKLKWVTLKALMSHVQLTHICLRLKMNVFPLNYKEQRDGDDKTQTKNMCECLWCIMHVGVSYALYMLDKIWQCCVTSVWPGHCTYV